MKNQDIQTLAENALHEACKHIQDELGVQSGDIAGLFFTGKPQDIIESILQDYIRREIQFKKMGD